MTDFPRTTVGGVSVSRLIIGTNWFLGYSHTSHAKDQFIKDLQTADRIADVLCAFLEYGVDTVMGPVSPLLRDAVGFLMQAEVDWVMRIIHRAARPVMAIKPLAAGRLLPPVGLAFVWNTLRDIDMVTLGTTTAAEAHESVQLSLDYLSKRLPDHQLQETRSKKALARAD